ncbi:MAG TPA: hypothetical protein VHW44_22430 [Pseudonocardiaceae bacterium]|jgi:hypothetical protein|nr:hypothetical protein [Pseudonocardiaceae bacterium]
MGSSRAVEGQLPTRAPAEEWERYRRLRVGPGTVLVIGIVPSVVVAGVVAGLGAWSGLGFVAGAVLLTGTPAAAAKIVHLVEDRRGARLSKKLGVLLVLGAYAAVAVLLGLIRVGPDQRCVDVDTMAVADSSNCQNASNQGSNGDLGSYAWYYGGTQTGGTIGGGSFGSPSDEGGVDGGSGNSGDSGGGDEGGADGGGGEG